MVYPIALVLLVALVLGPGSGLATAEKPRVIVLTDIENEPDDAQSMVRFLVYSNQWDVEALIATTSIHQKDKVAAWRIREIVQAYGKVRDNLEQHEQGFPTADHLLSVLREGRAAYGMTAVGPGMDSPGSERIIEVVDREDPRPVWVTVWGGPNSRQRQIVVEAYQNDFVARMDWTIKPHAEANHPPVPRLGHPDRTTARPGERVNLNAEGSSDPDGDALSYEWFYYNEAGTFPASSSRDGQPVPIQNFDQPRASFIVPTPRVVSPGTATMHIILAVTDHGTPRLTRYRRVIVEVVP